jgi:hypothetical protein
VPKDIAVSSREREQGNKGTREQGNKRTREQGNKGTRTNDIAFNTKLKTQNSKLTFNIQHSTLDSMQAGPKYPPRNTDRKHMQP